WTRIQSEILGKTTKSKSEFESGKSVKSNLNTEKRLIQPNPNPNPGFIRSLNSHSLLQSEWLEILPLYFKFKPTTMQWLSIVLFFLYIIPSEPLLFIRRGSLIRTKKLSSLPPDSIILWTIDYVIQPADPIAIFPDVKCQIDCSLLCVKNRHCVSTSFISKLKLCLLSSAPLKFSNVPARDKRIMHTVSTQLVNDDGYISYKTKSLGHGKRPRQCGMNAFGDIASEYRKKRIIGGYTPEPYQSPWVGLLVKEGKVRCTAFLISKNPNDKDTIWVLCAKHCFKDVLLDDDQEGRFNSTPFGLLFGFHDLRFTTQHVIYRTIDEVFIYPDEGLQPKDLVLIKLNTKVRFNSYINGLCLPDSADDHELYSDSVCTTCGFGATKASPEPVVNSDILHCIEVVAKAPHPDHSLYSDWNSVVKLKSSAFGPYHGYSTTGDLINFQNVWCQ
uniref:Peptidase S1 domain-containing protein n=1 Tax=Romanomermis culicivorax TaxID=13658 RepID=A0A915ID31_ROMCU